MRITEVWMKVRNFLVVITAIGGVSGTGYQTLTVSEERTAYNESVSAVIHEYTELLHNQKIFYREHIKILQEMLRDARKRPEGNSLFLGPPGEGGSIPPIKDEHIDLLFDIPDFPLGASK